MSNSTEKELYTLATYEEAREQGTIVFESMQKFISPCRTSIKWGRGGGKELEVQTFGLSKREHFASMAMQGMLSNTVFTDCYNTETLAQASVEYADALIKELNKKE